MATTTKTIQTRIKNRFDTLANWQGGNVTLLPGEIALVSVTTQQLDENTGNVVNVPAVLMKVGEAYPAGHEHAGQSKPFKDLPWLSAKAADVYDWAKTQKVEDVNVKIIDVDPEYPDDYSKATTETKKLSEWLKTFRDSIADHSEKIEALEDKVDLDTDETVTSKIADAIQALSFNPSTSANSETTFVTGLTLSDKGVVSVSKASIPEATDKDTKKGIVALGVEGGAAAYDSVFGDSTSGTLEYRIYQNEQAVESLREAVAGGVHFVGITETAITDKSKTKPTITGINNYTPENGDVVIYRYTSGGHTIEKEFIWVAEVDKDTGADDGCWSELGDLTLAGELSSWRSDLNQTEVSDQAPTDYKFVTSVTQYDGKITVKSYRPTISDVAYDTTTSLSTHLDELNDKVDLKSGETVTGKIDAAIKAIDGNITEEDALPYTDTIKYVQSISQDDGKVTAIIRPLHYAGVNAGDDSSRGILKGLSNATDSGREDLAATPKAVKAVQDNVDGLDDRVEAIENKYLWYMSVTTGSGSSAVTKNELRAGTDGNSLIIFDCGGAADI